MQGVASGWANSSLLAGLAGRDTWEFEIEPRACAHMRPCHAYGTPSFLRGTPWDHLPQMDTGRRLGWMGKSS
jgi:hypothetical protein